MQERTSRYYQIFFGAGSALAVTILFQIGAGLVVFGPVVSELPPPVQPLMLAAVQLTLMLVPTLLLARSSGVPIPEILRVRPVAPGMLLVALVGTLAMWGLIQTWLLVQEVYLIPEAMLRSYHELDASAQSTYLQLFASRSVIALLLALVAGAIVPAFCEELLFRGLAQRSMEQSVKPATAIALSALLFGVLHLLPFRFIPLALMGLFFGYLTYRSGSILPGILGHAIFNAVAIVAMYNPDGVNGALMSSHHTPQDIVTLLPVTVISVFVFVGIVTLIERRYRHR